MSLITYKFTVVDNGNQQETLVHAYPLQPGQFYTGPNGKRIVTEIKNVEVSGSEYRVFAESRVNP